MKKVTLLIVASLILSVIQAQKVYFIYLQSENQQTFYARMGEKIHNSSSSGYLILSNLRDSTYTIHIGFQGNQVPDQPFSITVSKKDQGYLLKNFGEKGWGLFNLQSMAVVMPVVNTSVAIVKTEKREGSEFTDLLAKASDDSTIKERPVITKTDGNPPAVKQEKPEEKASTESKETVQNEKKADQQKTGEVKTESAPAVTSEKSVFNPIADNKLVPAVAITGAIVVDKKETKPDSISSKPVTETLVQDSVGLKESKPVIETKTEANVENEKYIRSTVTLYSESSTTQGIGLTFLDISSDGKTDTIKIIIPAEQKKEIQAVATPEQKQYVDPLAIGSVKQAIVQPPVNKNKNCTQEANDDDFFKLRKRMAGQSSDDNMISEAKKAFKSKCFSTKQVKNLGSLFLTEEGRYKFFDASYNYVSDWGAFPSLQSEFKDEYYINRFKAMLRQ